ncbi:MAG: hypothetical protein JO022_13970, partial [Acidobacteriaceae bacterium]|nr:hypothetical protein [Acidobacteriaceae bacterium]
KRSAPVIGPETIVDGSLTLKQPLRVTGIRAKSMLENTSVQVIAERPDGTVLPLLWLYNYKPQFDHPYFYKEVLTLPAGTKIVCAPPGSGAIALISKTKPHHSTGP